MKVKIEHYGWCAAPTGQEFICPEGYHRYLCVAENGVVTWYNTVDYVQDGVYDLRDEDWEYDNPRFDDDKDCEEIEVA